MRYVTYTKVIFRGWSLIPETSAHFNQLFETSSNPCMTARASKQTMQNIIMVTVEFCLDNTKQKFADLSGNQLAIDFKRLFVLKLTDEIHISQVLDWVFSCLSHYSLMLLVNCC